MQAGHTNAFDCIKAFSAPIIENATRKVYSGAPHGLTDTHKVRLNADLLACLKA